MFFNLRVGSKSPAEMFMPIASILELCFHAILPCVVKLSRSLHFVHFLLSVFMLQKKCFSNYQNWKHSLIHVFFFGAPGLCEIQRNEQVDAAAKAALSTDNKMCSISPTDLKTTISSSNGQLKVSVYEQQTV